ncbi:MAG TPA: sarcosine oxidase subunit gamma family protein [Steroidobacteraceae bacterium]|jgi:sarcosine oxidase subunit gamma
MVDLELSVIPAGRAIVNLKTWMRAPVSLPSLVSSVAARLLTLGPDEWLMISDSLDGPGLHGAVAALARSHGMVAVDLSQGIAGLELKGMAARDLLASGCGLDLHPRSFPVGCCTRTRLAQLAVVIECTHSEPQYELYVGGSYLPYLKAWLEDAANCELK